MNNLISFTQTVDFKMIIAAIVMISMIITISYFTIIFIKSLKGRKLALKVKLPNIDGHGNEFFTEPQFIEPKEFVVEFLENEEISINKSKENETEFLTTLLIESKHSIIENSIKMPEIEKVDLSELENY